jgi:CDP-6-deoxy-D-xylo-4-hexulose-3-dehydrase
MIKLIKSTFLDEEETKKKLAGFILEAEVLSMGAECKKFEVAFSKKQGRLYSTFVANGSAANLALIQALLNLGRLTKGDTVALSSVTWATNVMPVIQLGLTPFLLDCELDNLNVSKRILEDAYKKNNKIKALFITNVLGFVADIHEIANFCKEKNIILLEDNCESLGSKTNNTMLGNFGLASTFSFFVGHHMSTIEGGMVCTDDKELCHMLTMVRAHGWDRNLGETEQSNLRQKHAVDPFFSKYTFYDLAYNMRPTEINGFIGNIQINFWDKIVAKREENFKKFHNATLVNKEIRPLNLEHMDIVSNFSFPVIFKTKKIFNHYKQKFEKNNVEIRPIISGNIQNQPFYKKYAKEAVSCDNAHFVHANGFYFGNNPEMTKEEIDTIITLLSHE